MKLISFLFAFVLLFTGLIQAEETDPGAAAAIYIEASDTDSLKAKEGQKVTVHGMTESSAKAQSGTTYVNFKGAEFYLVTFASDLEHFPDGEPHEAYDARRIAVTGIISIYKDKPQIKLTSPKMVRILGEEEEFPPKVAKAVATEKEKKPMAKTEAAKDEPEPEEPKRKPPVDAKKYFK